MPYLNLLRVSEAKSIAKTRDVRDRRRSINGVLMNEVPVTAVIRNFRIEFVAAFRTYCLVENNRGLSI